MHVIIFFSQIFNYAEGDFENIVDEAMSEAEENLRSANRWLRLNQKALDSWFDDELKPDDQSMLVGTVLLLKKKT